MSKLARVGINLDNYPGYTYDVSYVVYGNYPSGKERRCYHTRIYKNGEVATWGNGAPMDGGSYSFWDALEDAEYGIILLEGYPDEH